MKVLRKSLSVVLALTLVFGLFSGSVVSYAEGSQEIVLEEDGFGEEVIETASIGENWYATLDEAIEAVEDGQTITLGRGFDKDTNILIDLNGKTKKTFTLDLGGLEITGSADPATSTVKVRNAAVTIVNGKISAPVTKTASRGGIYAWTGSEITLGHDLEISGVTTGQYGYIGTYSGNAATGPRVTVDGAYIHDANSASNSAGLYCANYGTITILSGRIDTGTYTNTSITVEGGFFGDNTTFQKGSAGVITVKGGYFAAEPAGFYDTAGYEWVEDTTYDGYAGFVREKAVVTAMVENVTTGTVYGTLEQAIDDLSADGQTLKITDAFNTASDLLINGAAHAFTLDLNGKTVTGDADGVCLVEVRESEVTIVNGTLTSTTKTKARGGILVNAGAKVTLGSGLSVSGETTGSYGFIGTYENGILIIDGAVITDMTSGSAEAGIYVSSSGTMTVKSGQIDTKCYIYAASGKTALMEILGGRFGENSQEVSFYNGSSARCTIAISGGLFAYEPKSGWLAADHQVFANTDPDTSVSYPFTVGAKPAIGTLTIGDSTTDITALADAIAAIEADESKTGVITLNSDIDQAGTQLVVSAGTNVTVDLGGHTLQRTTSSRLLRSNGGDVTVKNGTILGSGTSYTGGNGACFYVNGGRFVLDGVTVKGFSAAKNTEGKYGVTGAVHVTGSGTFVMKSGSVITECSAEVRAGAVSVGSNCVFDFENGASITGCFAQDASAAQAVYVDVNLMPGRDFEDDGTTPREANYFGTFNYNGTITGNGTGKDVVSNGFVYVNGSLSSDYQAYSAAKITNAGAALTDAMALRYYPELALCPEDAAKTPVLIATVGGKDVEVALGHDEDGKSCFELPGVYADRMSDEIVSYVTLKEGCFDPYDGFTRSRLTETLTYSVAGYMEDLHSASPDDAKLLALVSDALSYGAAAAAYYNANCKTAGEDDLTVPALPDWAAPTTGDIPEGTGVRAQAFGPGFGQFNTSEKTARIRSAYLTIISQVRLTFVIQTNAPEGLKIYVGEENVNVSDLPLREGTTDQYVLLLAGLTPSEYDDTFTVRLCSGETVIQSVTYSVDSYLAVKAADSSLADLAKAIYHYGVSARNYAAGL